MSPSTPSATGSATVRRARVDAAGSGSVSFGSSDGPELRPVTGQASSQRGPEGHAFVAMGPGLPAHRLRAGLVSVYPFPITGTKIHPPLLRSDTLSRPRLNDWMDTAIQGRVVLVVAEAGFGKTTFLADWASATERRTAWYRLEPDDADWLTFLRHLVASGRELDPDFAAESLELLLALGSGGPGRTEIIATLVREYADFAAVQPSGLTLILDDEHEIEGSPETMAILRALVERTGPTFSIVIASRATPALPLGRLRSRGGLSRLEGEDLCFDVPETDRLFREAYRHPLEPDVITELIRRTDGWAALLTLVRTSLQEKDAPEARALVAQLSATRGDLYEFLAEEVMASLSPTLARFLTRMSVLVSVDAETGALVDDMAPADVVSFIAQAEKLGMLTRPDRDAPHRFHTLVRDFLYALLAEEIGDGAVRALHHKVAEALETTDWLGSAWHYRAAGDPSAAARVIDAAVPDILAAGAFELVAQFLDGSAGSESRPLALLLTSRLELERGNYPRALILAQRSLDSASPELSGGALLNLALLQSVNGFTAESLKLAQRAMARDLTPHQMDIARAAIVVAESQDEGDLRSIADLLHELAARQKRAGLLRYYAITRLNLAWIHLWLGDLEEAASAAAEAEVELQGTMASVYRVGAMVARAHALMRMRRTEEAVRLASEALATPGPVARDEAAVEAGAMHVDFGDLDVAESALASTGSMTPSSGYRGARARGHEKVPTGGRGEVPTPRLT